MSERSAPRGRRVATSTTVVPTAGLDKIKDQLEVAVSPSFAPPSNDAQAMRYIFDQQVLVSRTTSSPNPAVPVTNLAYSAASAFSLGSGSVPVQGCSATSNNTPSGP